MSSQGIIFKALWILKKLFYLQVRLDYFTSLLQTFLCFDWHLFGMNNYQALITNAQYSAITGKL